MNTHGRNKTFLLGVGCQKGGTTWLHHSLSAHPQVDFGFIKEYHVFDYMFIPAFSAGMAKKRKELETLQEMVLKPREPTEAEALAQRAQRSELLQGFRETPELYVQYFQSIWENNPSVEVVGDITPSYAGLSAENYREIKKHLEANGFAVKVIFLMRDPVDRVRSQIRMIHARLEKRGSDASIEETFATFFKDPMVEIRTRYENMLRALDEAFRPEDFLVLFFEEFFGNQSFHQVTDFLGISHFDVDFKKVFSYPEKETISEHLKKQARRYYASTHQYCMARYGEKFIKEIWPYA